MSLLDRFTATLKTRYFKNGILKERYKSAYKAIANESLSVLKSNI